MVPVTRYARTPDGLSIAYQTSGEGPHDVVFLRKWEANIEHDWEDRVLAHILERIGAFGRLILFDRRGTGLSDPIGDALPTLDARMDDLTAVLDAAGSTLVNLVSVGVGAASFCCFYAATHPARVSTMVLYNGQVCGHQAPDYPWGLTPEEIVEERADILERWGDAQRVNDARCCVESRLRQDVGGVVGCLGATKRVTSRCTCPVRDGGCDGCAAGAGHDREPNSRHPSGSREAC